MQLKITLCNPNNSCDEYILTFDLFETNISKKWQNLLLNAQQKYSIDDTERFYGLDNFEQESLKAINFINKCIDLINADKTIIEKKLITIHDTDTLNYLHHVFEIYHGLLDAQNHDFWLNAKSETKKALADLNIAVHRIENVIQGNKPRFVVTYFGLPKTNSYDIEDYNNFTREYKFGGLYLNYVEIGKTLEDLWRDNDQYIFPEAFQPYQKFSADFIVNLFDTSKKDSEEIIKNCTKYYNENYNFFANNGYPALNKKLLPGRLCIGQMQYKNKNSILKNIRNHQKIKSIVLS